MSVINSQFFPRQDNNLLDQLVRRGAESEDVPEDDLRGQLVQAAQFIAAMRLAG